MAVSMADIKHLRETMGAGMMDCKKALEEADGNFDEAVKILRKKGQAAAAKREDRETSEGCVLAKTVDGYAAVLALKCETDFVANNANHIKMTQDILDLVVENKCKSLEEVLALPMEGSTVADKVAEYTGVCGEKTEVEGFGCVEGETVGCYTHFNRRLATVVAFNQPGVDQEVVDNICMQVASMNAIAVSPEEVPAEVLEREKEIAADKARQEGKPENLIEKIAMGRINKFYKDVCLMNQELAMDENKQVVSKYLDSASKGLKVTSFHRFTLNAE